MKRITIDIYEDGDRDLKGLIEMNSDDLCLTYDNTPTMHGLQCNFDGDRKEFLHIQEVSEKIIDLVRELSKIYK